MMEPQTLMRRYIKRQKLLGLLDRNFGPNGYTVEVRHLKNPGAHGTAHISI